MRQHQSRCEPTKERRWSAIKRVKQLNTEIFSDDLNFVSVGKIRQDIVDSILEQFPEFADYLYSDTDILF